MGMSIDNAIEWYVGLECYTPQAKDAKDVAIDTMRKYQKIQEIVNLWNNTGGSAEESDILDYIEGVLEDGNNSL